MAFRQLSLRLVERRGLSQRRAIPQRNRERLGAGLGHPTYHRPFVIIREVGGLTSRAQPCSAAARLPQIESVSSCPLWLRDACDCSRCVDPSTRQKLFQTCDLPLNIKAHMVDQTEDTFTLTWENDLPTFGPEHVSKYKKSMVAAYAKSASGRIEGVETGDTQLEANLWDRNMMVQNSQSINFSHFQESEYAILKALKQLAQFGLILITGVPSSEGAVETIASRIGHLRETFYGRTWDVRSLLEARNVAYTNQYLGFHMDLLYMSNPPGLQLLHCLKSTCPGGASMFADAFKAAQAVKIANKDDYHILSTYPQTFIYKNAGEHYRFTRPVVNENRTGKIEYINWSPPFQGPFEVNHSYPSAFQNYVRAAKAFSSHVEAPENIYEYRMLEGDCFIFDNRRVLHARRAFETSSGERWLKGAYVDTDVFKSRFRVLADKMHKHDKIES